MSAIVQAAGELPAGELAAIARHVLALARMSPERRAAVLLLTRAD